MARLQPHAGGNPAGAAVPIASGPLPNTADALKLQKLLTRHNVHPALAPIIAALAWEVRP